MEQIDITFYIEMVLEWNGHKFKMPLFELNVDEFVVCL